MEFGLRNNSDNFAIDAVLIVLASIAVTLPIYLWGIPYGNDLPQHFQFAMQFENALRDGAIYPSWAPDPNGGLGDAGVRFYPPLAYYTLAIFKILAADWYTAANVAFAFWFCVGGFGIYFLSRQWFDSRSSVIGALVFTVLPYHVNQIYNAFFYAEFAGISVLPYCFLFVSRIAAHKKFTDILGLSAALAILVLTHLPTAVMGLIVLAVYTIVELWERWSVRSLFSLIGAGFLGAAASSFYWIKLVTELGFLNHATAEFTKSTFDFNANFLLAYFYVGPDQYVTRSLWFADLICILTIGVMVWAVIIRRVSPVKDGRKLSPFLAASGVAIFLATPLSWAVWANFDLLQKIQFPFRFLGVISICTAVLAASACNSFLETFASRRRPLALVSGGVLLFAAAFSIAQVIRPAMFLPQAKFDGLLAGLESEKSCECWWPVWANPTALVPHTSGDTTEVRSIQARINGVDHSAHIQIYQNESSAVEVFYYPLWQLSIDGKVVDVGPDEVGRILLPNTALDRNLELAFVEPAYIRALQVASIGAWIFIFIFSLACAAAPPRRDIALIL